MDNLRTHGPRAAIIRPAPAPARLGGPTAGPRRSAPVPVRTGLLPAAVAGLALLTGCAEFSSDPHRAIAGYGQSVQAMVTNQIYDPAKAGRPAALAPDGMEANKGDALLRDAYRRDIGVPNRVRQTPQIMGRGSASGGSGAGF